MGNLATGQQDRRVDGSTAYFLKQYRAQLELMPWSSPHAMAIGAIRALAGDRIDDTDRARQLRNALKALDIIVAEQANR